MKKLLFISVVGLVASYTYTHSSSKANEKVYRPILVETNTSINVTCLFNKDRFKLSVPKTGSGPYFDYILTTSSDRVIYGRVKQVGDTLYRITDGPLTTDRTMPILNMGSLTIDYPDGKMITCHKTN